MHFYSLYVCGVLILIFQTNAFRSHNYRSRYSRDCTKRNRRQAEKGPTKFKMSVSEKNEEQINLAQIVEQANDAVRQAELWRQQEMEKEKQNQEDADSMRKIVEETKMTKVTKEEYARGEDEDTGSGLKESIAQAMPLLQKIKDQIQKSHVETTEAAISRNDFPCSIDGQWISNVAGLKIRLETREDGRVKVRTGLTDVPHEGILHNCEWHLSGLVPSNRQGPFALAAVCSLQSRIATFVGQCKVCSNKETIHGDWMLSRVSRDCNDLMSAVEIKTDVWHRDLLPRLTNIKLRQIEEGKYYEGKSSRNVEEDTCN